MHFYGALAAVGLGLAWGWENVESWEGFLEWKTN
jgi:hypothetical protein